MAETADRETVLIVEDTEANIDVLTHALGDDYDLRVATDGAIALRVVAELHPDLILLDIMMPGIDGYEVCRRLKADPATAGIPILFLTALSDAGNEAKGLALGAVDYVAKPFHPELVKARVRNHLALRRAARTLAAQRDQLEADFQKLKALEQSRDDLVHMIVHDMRNPLTALIGFLRLTNEKIRAGRGTLADISKAIEIMYGSAERLETMITSMLDVSRLESGSLALERQMCDLAALSREVIRDLRGMAEQRKIECECANGDAVLSCDRALMRRVLSNLVSNAIQHTSSEGTIRVIFAPKTGEGIEFAVSDDGFGIAKEHQSAIFDKFRQIRARREGAPGSAGLGLTFCKLAVELHGGTIAVESEPDHGATFRVKLP